MTIFAIWDKLYPTDFLLERELRSHTSHTEILQEFYEDMEACLHGFLPRDLLNS